MTLEWFGGLQSMRAEISAVLNSIPELAWVSIDARGVEYISPRHHLEEENARPVLQYLERYAAVRGFEGEFFLCLYDGWREYSKPFDKPTFLPWNEVDHSRFTGLGSAGEPRFVHLHSDGIFPTLPLPVLAFCRHRGDVNTLLIPDPHFLAPDFQDFRRQVDLYDLDWEAKRADVLFWRGAKNVSTYPQQIELHHREFLTSTCLTFVDASYSRDVPISLQLQYKFLIDADGFVSTWSGLFWKLYSNSVPVKLRSHWEHWYYHLLCDRENIILSDFDLHATNEWLKANDTLASRVASAGKRLASQLTYEYALEEYVIA